MAIQRPQPLSPDHVQVLNRQRRIINQKDAKEPVMALGLDMNQWLKHRFDVIDTEGCQVDTIIWDIGLMADSYSIYDSKHLPPVDYYGLSKWRKQDLDWLGILVDKSHQRGLEVFWNSRISEVDYPQPFLNCAYDDPIRENYLKQEHPDWTVRCWWPQGLWNLASAELREHKIKVLRELLELYDIDGIQWDFARHTPCLPLGQEWELRSKITEFIRMARGLLLEFEKKKNKPLLLAARVAETIRGCHMDGMEIEHWVSEGLIDIFTLGGRTSTVDIASFKEMTKGTDIKLCPQFDGHHAADGYFRASVEYLRGVFSNWLHQGADSVGVFNWTCAHEYIYDELGVSGIMKSPSQRQILFEAGSLDTMLGKDKSYAVERKGGYPWAGNYLYRNDFKPLPCKLMKKPDSFPLYVYEKVDAIEADLEIVLSHASSEDMLDVEINEFKLRCIDKEPGWKDGQVYGDDPQPTAGSYACYSIDPEQQLLRLLFKVPTNYLFLGENKINVVLSDLHPPHDRSISIEKIELHVSG